VPPLRPGDLIVFTVSHNQLLVLGSRQPEFVPTRLGEFVVGLMTTAERCEMASMWVNYAGHGTFWNIVREGA
jgi:hypothetical protein